MKAIILAAGMGSRLGKYTKANTKAMVEVNGKKIIEHCLDILDEVNIHEVVIVVGYEKEKLMEFLGNCYKNIEIQYIENELYNQTNNIHSFWLARDYFDDDIILLESDIIFEKKVIERILEDNNKDIVVVDKYEKWMDGTVTLLNSDDTISKFIDKTEFNWNYTNDYYKTVNIYKLSKEFLTNKYLPYLEAYIKAEGSNAYYEQVLKVISSLKSVKLKAIRLDEEKWYEIDDAQDLDIASVIFSDEETILKNYQKRYGGYWRFPKLRDFCYLVNPYFPTESMKSEIKSSFDVLLSEYPSGRKTQELLAAKLFNCEEKHIILGNGASELIKELFKCIKGRVGVISPTFNEYGECIGAQRLVALDTSKNNYEYTVDGLKSFSEDIDALVLINPDNPSGHYLSKKDILELLIHFKEKNKILILDESFIDFAGKGLDFSFLDSDILEMYTNLIVIKSISKSFGVPGIRLGILASANQSLLEKLRSELPIWNINSFGEFFLQIIGKYKGEYVKACKLIANERDRFYKELTKISFLDVKPSKANYFLCKITKDYDATELSKELLIQNNILIKDCSGKSGFKENRFIRIAVRNKEDNNYLINVLRKLEE